MKEYIKPSVLVESFLQNEAVSEGQEVVISSNDDWITKLTSSQE